MIAVGVALVDAATFLWMMKSPAGAISRTATEEPSAILRVFTFHCKAAALNNVQLLWPAVSKLSQAASY
jgi:hypothetical protein